MMIRLLTSKFGQASFLTFLLWLASSASTPASKKTITIKLPGAVDKVTFDPNRESEKEVRKVISLSPNVASFNNLLVPEWLELCKSSSDRLRPCSKNPDKTTLIRNGESNLRSIKMRIESLSSEEFPSDLAPVVTYVINVQKFALWKESQRLAYLNSGDVSSLTQSFDGIEPSRDCGSEIEEIRKASPTIAFALTRHGWSNCVLRLRDKQQGPFPVEVWKRFLEKHDIQEKFIQDNGSDE